MSSGVPPLPAEPPPDAAPTNPARIYDAMIGGSHNLQADRDAVAQMLPSVLVAARANRSFLRRAVRFMAEQGVSQFLDLGSGLPTVGNVHEIAQRVNPDARVVYVDHEPVAVTHSRRLLEGTPNAAMVAADLRRPETVLDDPATTRLLDFDRPVGVLMVAVLHFVTDADDPAGIVGRYLSRLVAGSYLGMSHWSLDAYSPDKLERARAAVARYRAGTGVPVVPRDRAQLESLLAGVDLVEPGMVWIPEWRPDEEHHDQTDPDTVEGYCAVGRIPGTVSGSAHGLAR